MARRYVRDSRGRFSGTGGKASSGAIRKDGSKRRGATGRKGRSLSDSPDERAKAEVYGRVEANKVRRAKSVGAAGPKAATKKFGAKVGAPIANRKGSLRSRIGLKMRASRIKA